MGAGLGVRGQDSRRSLTATAKRVASAPSRARWSKVTARRRIGRIAIASSPLPVGDDPGAALDRGHAEDRDLGLVDDRRRRDGADRAGVGEGEGAAGEVVGGELAGAGALGEVGDRGADRRPPSGGLRSSDHRDEQALGGVDGDAEVDGLPVDRPLAQEGGVHLRVLGDRDARRRGR